MQNIRYISEEKIDFSEDFIFTFDVKGEKHKDFLLKLKIENRNSNEFLISNNLDTSYILKSNIAPSFSAVKKAVSNTNEVIDFFNDKIIIHNNEAYKNFNSESASEIKNYYRKDNVLYIKTDLYSFDGTHVIRNNPKDNNESYIRPVVLKTFKNGNIENNQTLYFDSINNPFNSNEDNTYRIIVSNKGCLITLLKKEKDGFKTIKNFTYPTSQGISEGKIILEIDNDMELSNLHFSFFKA